MTDCPACGHTVHASALGHDASTGATGCKFCSSATRLCADGGRDLDPDELAATIGERRDAAQSSADLADVFDDHGVRRYCEGRVAAYNDVLELLDADETPRIMTDGGLAAETVTKWECPRCGETFNGENAAQRHVDNHKSIFDVQPPREIEVREIDTAPTTLGEWERDDYSDGEPLQIDADDLATLTDAEREAFVEVDRNGTGVREFARDTDREPGTVGNLLARARDKLGVAADD